VLLYEQADLKLDAKRKRVLPPQNARDLSSFAKKNANGVHTLTLLVFDGSLARGGIMKILLLFIWLSLTAFGARAEQRSCEGDSESLYEQAIGHFNGGTFARVDVLTAQLNYIQAKLDCGGRKIRFCWEAPEIAGTILKDIEEEARAGLRTEADVAAADAQNRKITIFCSQRGSFKAQTNLN
jgi:hypothetical protein